MEAMPVSTRPTAPLALMFGDDGSIPNNPRLPLLVYRGAIDLSRAPSVEDVVESTFTGNGWGDMWRNGISVRALSFHDPRGARHRARPRQDAFRWRGGENTRACARRRRGTAGRHRPPVPVGDARAVRHRCLSQARKLRSLPRRQGRTCQGAPDHPGGAAAG